MTSVALLLGGLLLASSGEEAREAIFGRLKPSIVVLQATSAAGDRLSHGTGFVLRPDGLVVTNHHVVQDQASMEAVFADGRRAPVTGLVFSEERNDLAVLRIDADRLSALELGTSEGLREGARIFVGGNPLGLDFSFAEGSVSAVRPDGLPAQAQSDADRQALLQLDVNSDSGGSGSPVVDDQGQVVGIIRAKVGRSVFAVPVETLRHLLRLHPLDETPARPLKPFPWWNLVLSGLVLGTVLLLLRMQRFRTRGAPRSPRRFRGYEE